MRKLIILLMFSCLLLSACGQEEPTATTEPTVQAVSLPSPEEMFTDRDRSTEYKTTPIKVTLNGNSATTDSKLVSIQDSTVTLKSEGTYVLSGQLEGTVIVDADSSHKLQLVLDGASIHSPSSAAIYVKQADKVFITLSEGTENTLSSGESFTTIDENNIDGAVFSKDDLTFNGSGKLTVLSPAGHGIVCKDDLVLTGGSYLIQCASHGLDANDSIRITDSSISVTAGKDALHAENSDDNTLGFVYIQSGAFTISAEGDGISAGSTLQIADGSFTITTGGGAVNGSKPSSEGYGGFMGGFGRPGDMNFGEQNTTTSEDSTSIKGLKAGGDLSIASGSFALDCADDGIHSNQNLSVSGGTFTIATGDDGLHADETLSISSGSFTVSESYEGIEGLNISISGGDIRLTCSDDGINAAGGNDASGFGGGRGDQFGGRPGGRPGGMGGMGGMNASSGGSITISGGTIYMNASGDGIDANGTLTISGGHTIVCGPTRGDTSVLDYDVSATITGGTFIGTGASGMAQSFSAAEQGLLGIYTGSCAADTKITLTDTQGSTLLEYAPALDYEILIFSCPEMVSGESYTVTIGQQSTTLEAE